MPAAAFGSRWSNRCYKLTLRTWESMASATYIAQAFAPPSMRIVHGGHSLKADVRCFASEAGVLLFAARLYQGQTTNMRTRSEEHTSELQSLMRIPYSVFGLKKKK